MVSLFLAEYYSTLSALVQNFPFEIILHKRFRNPESIITLYKAYVRSHVEYCSVVWSPISQNSVDKVERVQRKFTRMLYRKFNWPKVECHQRLERLKLPLLESRRYIADEKLLYKVFYHHF